MEEKEGNARIGWKKREGKYTKRRKIIGAKGGKSGIRARETGREAGQQGSSLSKGAHPEE